MRNRKRFIKEEKGSMYDLMRAVEDRIYDLEDDFSESLDEAVSEDDVRELTLFIPNAAPLNTVIKATIDNLKRKIKRGVYDEDKAIKAWENIADAGVKLYDKLYGSGRGSLTMLDKPTRHEIAIRLMNDYDEQVHEDDVQESLRLREEESDKRWLNTEVTKDEYKKLKKFLVDNGIKHEASGAYNLIHVEVYVDEYEKKKLNDFLDTLDEGCYGRRK